MCFTICLCFWRVNLLPPYFTAAPRYVCVSVRTLTGSGHHYPSHAPGRDASGKMMMMKPGDSENMSPNQTRQFSVSSVFDCFWRAWRETSPRRPMCTPRDCLEAERLKRPRYRVIAPYFETVLREDGGKRWEIR